MLLFNFFVINLEVQKYLIELCGEFLCIGILNMLQDMECGKILQMDEMVFEIGCNVVNSEGVVVFENDYFQFIQYKLLMVKVYVCLLLLVLLCINKFYILDLQLVNLFVCYVVEQGNIVFLVFWCNLDVSMVFCMWDDYIEGGVIEVICVVCEIFVQDQINVLGFCVGGMIFFIVLVVLVECGEYLVVSLMLLIMLFDFMDIGIFDVFVDQVQVEMWEKIIGSNVLIGLGLLCGVELVNMFLFF